MSTPTPRPRDSVATIPAYVPGKPPIAREGQQVFKLSSNENPYPPLPGVVEAVAAAAATMNRYPDMGCTDLYAALARRLDVEPDQLVAGTGSVAVLYHLLQAYCEPGDEVVHAWRSFEAYPIAIAVAGATAVPVPLAAGGRHDLDAMSAAITDRTKVVLVCTPNNPTGPALGQAELAAFVARVPSDVIVVVDEAYREFVRHPDPVDAVALSRTAGNVVALRTFAKAYGLAGLRIGYLVGDSALVAAVRACALPFGVSNLAQVAVLASLEVEDVLLDRVEKIVAERGRVLAAFEAAGWQVPDPQGNFVWLDLGNRTEQFVAVANEMGIMVRPFAGEGVRVSIGESAANDIVVQLASAAF